MVVLACQRPDFLSVGNNDSTLQWRHKEHGGVSNHQLHDCVLNRSFKAQIIKALSHWPLGGEFTSDRWIPLKRVSYVENISIWWRHHGCHSRPQSRAIPTRFLSKVISHRALQIIETQTIRIAPRIQASLPMIPTFVRSNLIQWENTLRVTLYLIG